jgi:hypothetical protein
MAELPVILMCVKSAVFIDMEAQRASEILESTLAVPTLDYIELKPISLFCDLW